MTTPADASGESNDLPRASNPLSRLAIGFVLLALGILFVAFLLMSSTLRDMTGKLNKEARELATMLAVTPTPSAEESALQTALNQERLNLNALVSIRVTLDKAFVVWPAIMSAISQYDSNVINVITLTLTERRINLTGYAASENQVMEYVQSMRNSGRFSQVVMQSVSVQPSKTKPSWLPQQLIAEFSIVVELKPEQP